MKIFKQLSSSKYFDNVKHNWKEISSVLGPLLQASRKADKFAPCWANCKIFLATCKKTKYTDMLCPDHICILLF